MQQREREGAYRFKKTSKNYQSTATLRPYLDPNAIKHIKILMIIMKQLDMWILTGYVMILSNFRCANGGVVTFENSAYCDIY